MNLFRPRLKGLTALEINFFLNRFATGMIGVFGVLFIFHLNRVGLAAGILLVTAFFGLQRVIVAAVLPAAGWLTGRYGYRNLMSLGSLALLGKLVLFTQIDSGLIWLLIPAAVLGGLHIAGYFPGYHAVFLETNDDEKIGTQIGTLEFLGSLAEVSSPLLAGIMIDRLGFPLMFTISLLILAASIVPLWMKPLKDRKSGGRRFFPEVGNFYREHSQVCLAVTAWHVTGAVLLFFWPIYAYLILGSYSAIGALAAAVILSESLVIIAAGRIYDKRPLRRLYPLISVSVAAAWVMKFLASAPAPVFAADIIHRTISPLWWMKIRRSILVAGETVDHLVFGLAWEWLVTVGFLAGLVACYLLLVAFNFNWLWLAVPAVGGVVGATVLMKNEK